MSDGAGSVKAGFRQPGAFRAADSENGRDALSEAWATRDAARLPGRAKEGLPQHWKSASMVSLRRGERAV